MILDNITEEINKATDIVILTHETPDGDAIGSSLALYGALKSMGKNVDVIIPDCPPIFSFLPWFEEMKKEGKEILESKRFKKCLNTSHHFNTTIGQHMINVTVKSLEIANFLQKHRFLCKNRLKNENIFTFRVCFGIKAHIRSRCVAWGVAPRWE